MAKHVKPRLAAEVAQAGAGTKKYRQLGYGTLLGLLAHLLACGGPPAAGSESGEPATGEEFFLQLPELYARSDLQMTRLRAALAQADLTPRREYSDLVGLRGTVSVRASARQLQALMQELPQLQARAVVWRYPLATTCGDGRCDLDEAATTSRSSTCSADCGAVPRHSDRDELSNSWQAITVGAPKAWTQTRGAGIHIGILDTGYDSGPSSSHPDRPQNLGAGYNFATSNGNYAAVSEHGTHVAGIIAAPSNGAGMVGIAPEATLHIYQVFQARQGQIGAADSDIIAAIEMAIRDKVNILNLSLGGTHDSELEHRAIQQATQAGLLVVVAAGNSEDAASGKVLTATKTFPGSYPESFSVGATTRSEEIAAFSATGSSVRISAPGQGVYSTVPVRTGEREVRAQVQLDGQPAVALSAALPVGSSGTSLPSTALVSCGFGSLTEVSACAPLDKIALISRGPAGPGQTAIPFSDKLRRAREQGAAGLLLYNHRYGDAATAGGILDSISLGTGQPIPVLGLAAGDGEFLLEQLQAPPNGRQVRAAAAISASDYATFDGTSMAAPVVAGVAALVWSAFPNLTATELRQLLSESAVDLGAPGRDDAFGAGRVDAWRAIQQGHPRTLAD